MNGCSERNAVRAWWKPWPSRPRGPWAIRSAARFSAACLAGSWAAGAVGVGRQREFENGHWYVDDVRDFARQIGIPEATNLRKDEIEEAIVAFLRSGAVRLPTKRALRKTGAKDVERGPSVNLRIEHYTCNRETKDFIVWEARTIAPEVREKSGVWYRLNRWREEQITRGATVPREGEEVRPGPKGSCRSPR